MRALAGRIPRALTNHRSPEGAAYRVYLHALIARLGSLPDAARPTLREAGRLVLDLDRLRRDQEAALRRGRRTEARRIDRRLVPMRTQLLTFEARLEELADSRRKPTTGAELLAMRGR